MIKMIKRCLISITLLICIFSLPGWAIIDVAQLNGEVPPMGSNPLIGVPQYNWYYGCSPTAGGMVVGYWDSHPSGNWANLVEGNVSSWNTTAMNMVASPEHLADYWGSPDPNPGGHLDNCLADFMHTSRSGDGLGDGGTWSNMVPVGLKNYTQWDDPTTVTNEAYYVNCWRESVEYRGGLFTWEAFKAEIDAGNPMLVNVIEYHGTATGWSGHSLVGYGYQENMFNIKILVDDVYGGIWSDIRVGGFAVWDTWDTTSSLSSWLGWDWNPVSSFLDVNGVEWWPFLDLTVTNGWSYNSDYWDWAVFEGVYYHPGNPIPEPGTWFLLGCGLLGLVVLGRKRISS